jgi:hypothetical protein
MGSSRLQNAADILGVAVTSFFEGVTGHVHTGWELLRRPTSTISFPTKGLRLAKAFMQIWPALRHLIVDLVNEIAGEHGATANKK